MKLIKFIAATALIASTSFVSGGSVAPANNVSPQIAACYNWPYCRDVDTLEQAAELKQYIAACYNWPYCRDVGVVVQTTGTVFQEQIDTVRKAV